MFINNIKVTVQGDKYLIETPNGSPVTVEGKDVDSFLRAVSRARHPSLYQHEKTKPAPTVQETNLQGQDEGMSS